jgi:hypothetical protein
MDRLKRAIKGAILLPPWFILTVSIPAFALLLYFIIVGSTRTVIAYVSYAVSGYALMALCAAVVREVRTFRFRLRDAEFWKSATLLKIIRKLRTDALYRAEVALYGGLLINVLYAAVKLVSGIAFNSLWFGALAGYYLLLAIMRFALLSHVRRSPAGQDPESEWRRYRLCGGGLLVMNQALAVVVFFVVRRSSGFVYPGILIYGMSAYTFYAVINAIRNLVKFKKHGSPVMSAAKVLNLVAALVSLLSLETAMLTRFGIADDVLFRKLMTGSTGGAVCVIVVAIAVYMIVHATNEIKALRQ